jgi:hypothetical protein
MDYMNFIKQHFLNRKLLELSKQLFSIYFNAGEYDLGNDVILDYRNFVFRFKFSGILYFDNNDDIHFSNELDKDIVPLLINLVNESIKINAENKNRQALEIVGSLKVIKCNEKSTLE